MILDIHAHLTPTKLDGRTIISLSIGDEDFTSSFETCRALNVPLSIGLHPWHVNEGWKARVCNDLIPRLSLPQVAAIGEAGIDRVRGGDIALQIEAFEMQARLAKEVGKPLIVHCVKAFDEVIRLHKQGFPHEPWIIHAFRGKPEQARQLLREGFLLSFGEHFNTESLRLCPADHLLIETDESHLSIGELYTHVATTRHTEMQELMEEVKMNIRGLMEK